VLACEALFQSLSLLLSIRSMARGGLDFHCLGLGALPGCDVDRRPSVLDGMAEGGTLGMQLASVRLKRDCKHGAFPYHLTGAASVERSRPGY
jgi:hypothetical protein